MSGLFPSKLQIAFVPKSLSPKIAQLRAAQGLLMENGSLYPNSGQKTVHVSNCHLLITEGGVHLQKFNSKHLI